MHIGPVSLEDKSLLGILQSGVVFKIFTQISEIMVFSISPTIKIPF